MGRIGRLRPSPEVPLLTVWSTEMFPDGNAFSPFAGETDSRVAPNMVSRRGWPVVLHTRPRSSGEYDANATERTAVGVRQQGDRVEVITSS